MKKKLNAILILTLVLALALSCLAGCAKKDDGAAKPADSGESAGGKTKIALVLPGKKDDVSFNQAMYEGVMAYAENHAEEVEVKVVENIYETSDIIATYVYRQGMVSGNMSYASAIGLFSSIINLVLLVTANYFSKKFSDTGLF